MNKYFDNIKNFCYNISIINQKKNVKIKSLTFKKFFDIIIKDIEN